MFPRHRFSTWHGSGRTRAEMPMPTFCANDAVRLRPAVEPRIQQRQHQRRRHGCHRGHRPPTPSAGVVVQTISQSRDYVEVGGLFPSVSTTGIPNDRRKILGRQERRPPDGRERRLHGRRDQWRGDQQRAPAPPRRRTYPTGGTGQLPGRHLHELVHGIRHAGLRHFGALRHERGPAPDLGDLRHQRAFTGRHDKTGALPQPRRKHAQRVGQGLFRRSGTRTTRTTCRPTPITARVQASPRIPVR